MDGKYHNMTSKHKDVCVFADPACRNFTFGLVMVKLLQLMQQEVGPQGLCFPLL